MSHRNRSRLLVMVLTRGGKGEHLAGHVWVFQGYFRDSPGEGYDECVGESVPKFYRANALMGLFTPIAKRLRPLRWPPRSCMVMEASTFRIGARIWVMVTLWQGLKLGYGEGWG